MHLELPLTSLVTISTLLIYFWMARQVGVARGKYEVPAPRTDGPEAFLRVQRVHGNTMEGLLLFLPALWIFAFAYGDVAAAAIGLFYPVGRIIFARGYYQAADKRGRGFMIGLVATGILLLGDLVAALASIADIYLS
ncbi:MAG: MAPEG family protein [Parvibaculaceae bacterium]|nr:MAPEG domain-containing protein [Rhodobiaceae bacterium]MBG53923.1 MAPEG domain-containing protein [Rhodobiaceae bacterium]MDF1625697.1 MAPEG family protein [Parvibaculaceae bacterium]